MEIGIIASPEAKPQKSSTIHLAQTLQDAFCHNVAFIRPESIAGRNTTEQTLVRTDDRDWFLDYTPEFCKTNEGAIVSLSYFDYVLLRMDPPVDTNYCNILQILDRFSATTPVVNAPRGLLHFNGKINLLDYPNYTPLTIIGRSADTLWQNMEKHSVEEWLIKPTNGRLGTGITVLKQPDYQDVEAAVRDSNRPMVVQECLPVKEEGEVRTIIANGEVVGQALKYPQDDSFNASGNIKAYHPCQLTDQIKKAVEAVGSDLVEQGIKLATVDFVESKIIEINVTCPAGFAPMDQYHVHDYSVTQRIASRVERWARHSL